MRLSAHQPADYSKRAPSLALSFIEENQKKMKILNAYFDRPEPLKLIITIPAAFGDELDALIESANNRRISQLSIELKLPHRPRSTGYRSQNSRLYGNCESLAEQLVENGEPLYTEEQIKDAMMWLAVEEGYPTIYSELHKKVLYKPSRYATIEELDIVLRAIQKFADEHGFWLIEYDDQGTYRSIGGRSRKEMEDYYDKR